MAHALYEHEIETRCVQLFIDELHYDTHLNLWQLPDDGNAAFGRKRVQDVVSETWLNAAIAHLNPLATPAMREAAAAEMTRARHKGTLLSANQEVHTLLINGFLGKATNAKSVSEPYSIRYIDFATPSNNHFAIVQQLTIKGKSVRRPDLIVYVNGLPLIFIELKNLTEPTKSAYDKNVSDYKRDIPNLFHYNLLMVLSNGIETKVGSMSSEWEHYFNWEKAKSENEMMVPDGQEDLPTALYSLCQKETIIDMLQHFVLYYLDKAKIVAKNHQYLGVNNAVTAYKTSSTDNKGRLGVFWHTQGSGKSFSMAFFVKKMRQMQRNLRFVIVTDRTDLEDQILQEFERTHIIPSQKSDTASKQNNLYKSKGVRAQDSLSLQTRLKGNDTYVFTLIQKFQAKKGATYPVLSESADIIVIVDEAHRSNYSDLAQNMRTALPNAQYIAFTGTPLLGKDEKTKEWFGDYVSRYDFLDSVADGSTVRIFHQNRVPKVALINDSLNADIKQIFHDENLTDEQQEKLIRDNSELQTVIGDQDRLVEVAQDIVKHFVNRGYLGKALVVSITKEVAVKMYDLVQNAWREYRQTLQKQRTGLPKDSTLRQEIDMRLKYMTDTEMAVVISYSPTDEVEFEARGLNLRPHIAKMEKIGKGYETIEDRFKAPNDPLRLVFVCAKWLTGFDAPTISTLYLDKPMQNHTLMQTIARANRVAPALNRLGYKANETDEDRIEKKCGNIIDYIDVFKDLQIALSKYGKSNSDGTKTEFPSETMEDLILYLDAAITEGITFLTSENIDIQIIINRKDVFSEIEEFISFADLLSKTEELKKTFGVHQTAITALYQACKPHINDEDGLSVGIYIGQYKRINDAFEYLRKIIKQQNTPTTNLAAIQLKAEQLIDESIIAKDYTIKPSDEIDLTCLDLEKLEKKFAQSPYKNLAISDFKTFLANRVQKLLAQNVTRLDLAERLQAIIERYNDKGSDVLQFFADLKAYAQKLRKEEVRAAAEGLSEAELEIFDLLFVENLTKEEKQKVKAAAKTLLQKLKDQEIQRSIFVTDWFRHISTCKGVEHFIGTILDENLPETGYPKEVFMHKKEIVYTHLYRNAEQQRAYWM